MRTEDLKTLAEIGRAIWNEPSVSERTTLETVVAVTLQETAPERILERAAAILLERAARQGTAGNSQANLSALGQPFFRLTARQRFLLVALHLGRWSYARIGRIFNETPDRVEQEAWVARVELSSLAMASGGAKTPYPAGGKPAGMNCPEYNPQRPWTQRFLDEEIESGSERLFLQNHLMACDSCRAVLTRFRETYFAVEKLIPRLDQEAPVVTQLVDACRETRGHRFPSERSLRVSLALFVRRWEVQAAVAAFLMLLFFKILT